MESTHVNSLGLLLDIAGVVMLFFYGLPAGINREGTSFLTLQGSDEAMKQKAKRYDRLAQIALGLLVFGFALQLISNFMK